MDAEFLTQIFNQAVHLIGDVHQASQHHYANALDDLVVVGGVAEIGVKLYQQGKAYYRTKSSPRVLASTWDDESTISFNKQTGAVGLCTIRQDGSGYNAYFGSGKIFSNSMDIIVSGYNSYDLMLLIRIFSQDGYRANMIVSDQSRATSYLITRTSEWYVD